jgi:D-alanine-D-alanine ligase-like ATP-grasp enzyme
MTVPPRTDHLTPDGLEDRKSLEETRLAHELHTALGHCKWGLLDYRLTTEGTGDSTVATIEIRSIPSTNYRELLVAIAQRQEQPLQEDTNGKDSNNHP